MQQVDLLKTFMPNSFLVSGGVLHVCTWKTRGKVKGISCAALDGIQTHDLQFTRLLVLYPLSNQGSSVGWDLHVYQAAGTLPTKQPRPAQWAGISSLPGCWYSTH